MKMTVTIVLFLLNASTTFASETIDKAKIEAITGLKGKSFEDEGVFKISQPRTDVKVAVDRFSMPPFMGLTSWVSFAAGKKAKLMIMGDLVLFQDEVNPVMSTLFDGGIDVTALHNHFFYDEPKVYFMHISGEGEVTKLSQSIRAAFDKVKEIRASNTNPANHFETNALPTSNSISPKPIEMVFGQPGESKDGMYKQTVGRKVKMSCGCEIGKSMGVNTWAAFAGTDDDAMVDGDFAVLESELQKVLRSLRKQNINIVAIHHHMTDEKPRMLFLHYWGRGKAIDLAKSVQNTLEQIKK